MGFLRIICSRFAPLLGFLCGCTSLPQKLDPTVFYKRDLPFCVKDIGCYEGTAVIPHQNYYEFEVAPKGDAEIDMLVMDTCHREFTQEGADKGWLDYFQKFFGKKRQGYKVHYSPVNELEDDGDCTIRINTFEKEKGRHAWAVIRLEHPRYTLPATVICNGEVRESAGVSVCQSKAGLSQQIKFSEPVMIEADKGCEVPVKGTKTGYEWNINLGECGYTVKGKSGRLHDLLAIGYDGLLVREVK